ncbi:MAG TPA: conjugal transfer protein TraD [Phenylobacterium sp.]
MRKPRDLDAELQALAQRAKALKTRRIVQFGELVISTGADQLDPEVLAGALLDAAKAPASERERWGAAGAAAFRKAGGPARATAQDKANSE